MTLRTISLTLCVILVMVLSDSKFLSVYAQETDAEAPASHTPKLQEYTIQPGESLYALIANTYPGRMNRWIEVAEDLIALNPDAFPRGMDTPLRPGVTLKLVNYDAPKAATASVADRNKSADKTAGQVAREIADNPQGSAPVIVPPDLISRPTIGTATVVEGQIVAINLQNGERRLTAGSSIYSGDTIVSRSNSTATLMMLDKALYMLRPDSRLHFESYVYSSTDNKGRSIVTLINGGFRTTSGLLGEHDPQSVTFNTPVATVGLHGADFGLYFCVNHACTIPSEGSLLTNGLYSGVLDGAIVLTNNTGQTESIKGDFYRISNPDNPPSLAPEAALLLFSADELQALDTPPGQAKPLGFLGWLKHRLFGD